MSALSKQATVKLEAALERLMKAVEIREAALDASDPLDRPLTVTIFPNHAASCKSVQSVSLRDLAHQIESRRAESKARLPLLKLAKFGETRSDKGSLRHRGNLVAIHGVEADYDGGVHSPEWAAECLKAADIAALVYTSPSHTKKKPRWRVLCPLSKSSKPEERRRLVALLNGALGGVLATESFNLSQAFYFGRALDNVDAAHRTILVSGRYINEATDLEGVALYTKGAGRSNSAGGSAVDPRKKRGVVGAYCRAFSIEDVLADELAHAYDGADGRYRFHSSDSAPGLVVLGAAGDGEPSQPGGLWAYSHHGTDPAAGGRWNAFDLVRAHHHGHLDEGVPDDVPVNERPSHKAMMAEALKVPAVQEELAAAQDAEIDSMFDDAEFDDTTPPFPSDDQLPRWGVYFGPCGPTGLRPAGVYWHEIKGRDNRAERVDTRVCAPLTVTARTSDLSGTNHGRLLDFVDTGGIRKRVAMPMAELAGDGKEALAQLLSLGLEVNPRQKRQVMNYIMDRKPNRDMRAATTTGWYGTRNAFVLPDQVIGADDVWLQLRSPAAGYGAAGTPEGWRTGVAARAIGNPLLLLAMCAGFAGPLLKLLNVPGGGLNLFGDSSTGKSTGLCCGASIWGKPDTFGLSWRATANALEAEAARHSDTLLPLDELGQVEPRALYECAYTLANGQGKARADRMGGARETARWRAFVLSTGETTVAARIESGNIQAKAGQELRILDVPVQDNYGLFNQLHGFSDAGRLADALRDAAAQHHGHAGPAFVQRLVDELERGLDLGKRLEPVLATLPPSESAQEGRAARLFAVAGLAGELAAEWLIVTWPAGAATTAASRGFKLWRDHRGKAGGKASEHRAILQAVADFIGKHGDARFSGVDEEGYVAATDTRDRAGWRRVDEREGEEQTIYMFQSGALREATKGHDLARVVKALREAGALVKFGTGKRGKQDDPCPHTRIRGYSNPRLYHVDPSRLDPDAGEAEQ